MGGDTYQYPRPFPSTHWTSVGMAGADAAGARDALGRLLQRYMPALKTHLVLQMHVPAEQADDLLHGFVSEKVLEQGIIARADKERGRFRSFLRRALENHVISNFRRAGAQKRTPARADVLALDEATEPEAPGGDLPDAYDVAWARELLAEAVRRMQAECRQTGRADIWGVFECRLLSPSLEGTEPLPYAELVERFGLLSPVQAANVLVTAKRMFARHLRSVVAEYAEEEADVEEEIGELKAILAGPRAGSRP